jgi:hypothetical protein
MNFGKSILFFLVVLPFLAGCGKDAPRKDEASDSSSSVAAVWPKPFSPTAPPPLADGPLPKPGLSPTQYASARVGAGARYRVTPERGSPSRQTIEIVRTDATTAYAHQTVETKKFGRHVQHLDYNRFVAGAPAVDRFNPANRENYIGDRIFKVGSKKLLCRVYEVHKGSSIYRTLMCDSVPGKLVRHSDNAAGVWKTRLQLTDVWD